MDNLPWLAQHGQHSLLGNSHDMQPQLQVLCDELAAAGTAESNGVQGVGRDIFDPYEATGECCGLSSWFDAWFDTFLP